VSLLKEKAKELKLVQKKLTKVEDKFVETHKLQKALVRDRETLQLFLNLVFGGHPQTIAEVLLGDSPD
jgi:cellobiose-specific phosphotransferase system component IIA